LDGLTPPVQGKGPLTLQIVDKVSVVSVESRSSAANNGSAISDENGIQRPPIAVRESNNTKQAIDNQD
jgi:hypothetical protein